MAFYSMHEGAGLASERAVPNAGGRLIGQRCGMMLERCGGKKWPGWPFGVDKYRNETILLNDDGSEGIDCGEPLFAAATIGAEAPVSAAGLIKQIVAFGFWRVEGLAIGVVRSVS